MAKRTSILDDLVDITAKLPWWVGVLLALVAYIGLHQAAQLEAPKTTGLGNMGNVLVAQLARLFANIGQYILPIVFLFGAALSAYGRYKRRSLLNDVRSSKAVNNLDGMSWHEFEMLVGEAFRRRGYIVTESGGGGPDGGVDLVLKKGSETFLVQCKQWKAFKVSVQTVRELFGVMAAKGVVGGFVVTSGKFTKDAREFADGRNIELLDGPKLFALIKDVQGDSLRPSKKSTDIFSNAPLCPKCATRMVLRKARRGSNPGSKFWGCPRYPSCRGTFSI